MKKDSGDYESFFERYMYDIGFYLMAAILIGIGAVMIFQNGESSGVTTITILFLTAVVPPANEGVIPMGLGILFLLIVISFNIRGKSIGPFVMKLTYGTADPNKLEKIQQYPFSSSEWVPIEKIGRGSYVNPHLTRLVKRGEDVIKFKATSSLLVLSIVFIIFPAGILLLLSKTIPDLKWGDDTIPFAIICLTLLSGVAMLFSFTSPVVFDRKKGYFKKGRKSPNLMSDRERRRKFANLDDIEALQLLSAHNPPRSAEGSIMPAFYSYELNIILTDGGRINIVTTGNFDKICKDAKTLSAFLNKPLRSKLLKNKK